MSRRTLALWNSANEEWSARSRSWPASSELGLSRTPMTGHPGHPRDPARLIRDGRRNIIRVLDTWPAAQILGHARAAIGQIT